MENFEKDVKEIVLDMLAKEVPWKDVTNKIDAVITTRLKEAQDPDTTDKSGKDFSSSPRKTKTETDKGSEKKLSLCAVCSAEADKTCGACKSVSYCSVEHQRLHWKSHKTVCSSFIIQETETMGKEWIASRDLPADTILLEEAPVLSGPKWDYFELPCCLTCEVAMINTKNKDRKCSTCSWPICSVKCEKSSLHAENECKFFCTHKMKYSNAGPVSSWNGSHLLLIRANNLKLKNKSLFDKIMKLQDFQVIPNRNYKLSTEGLLTSIRDQAILPLTSLTDVEYMKLVRIIGINSYTTSQATLEDKISLITLLYLQSSRINYSCAPNCILSNGVPPDFKARIRTAVPVKKGESLTVSYYDPIKVQPTLIRQQYLQTEVGFMCKCERCLDPTELGTFITGITCQKCGLESKNKKSRDDENLGYFLPENPLDLSFDSVTGSLTCDPQFKCNGCGETKPFSVLKSSLPSDLQRAFEDFNHDSDLDFDMTENIDNAEAFLAKYESGGKYLHKNHYLIHTLVEKILPTPAKVIELGLNKSEMERAVSRIEYLLQIHEKIFPGLSDHKAELSIRLMLIVCRLLQRYSHQLSTNEIGKLVATAQTCYKEGMKYFKKDSSVNGKWMPQQFENGMNLLKSSFASFMDSSI